MTSSVRQFARALTAFGLALGALVAVAPTAQAAAPTNATISETRWLIGETKAVTVSWTTAVGDTNTVMVRSPWPWGGAYVNNETQTATGARLSTAGAQTVRCTDSNSKVITFTIDSATVGATQPVCNYKADGQYWEGFWLTNLTVSGGTNVSVAIASGIVTAPTTARTDTWLVGPLNGAQATIATEAYAPPRGKVGFDPATDTAPTGPVKLELNATQTEATCTAPTYSISPSRYIYEFIASGQRIGEPIGTTAGSATVKLPPVTGSFGYRLSCNLTAFANNSAYTAWANVQVGKDPEREGPPKAPGNVKVTAMAKALLLEWDPAVSTGYPVTNYLGAVSPGIRVCITTLADTSPTRCVINGLNPRTAYKAEVQALSGNGWGERGYAATSTHPFAVAFNNIARKKLLFGLAGQEVTVTGIAPGVPTGATVQVMHRIGNGTWKTINAKVSRSSAATDRDGSGTFVAKLKLTGKDAKATVDIKATYVDQALIGTPYKAYATSTTVIREVKSA